MAILLSTFPKLGIANTKSSFTTKPIICSSLDNNNNPTTSNRRNLILQTSLLCCCAISLTPQLPPALSSPESILSSIQNTSSWYRFYGDGFAIRVPPEFQDVMEPEVHSFTNRV